MSNNEVRIEVENWRGLSAYEVAKKNGFNGTELEWIESLGGNVSITVNEKVPGADGNIEVLASDIKMVEEGQLSVKDKIDGLEKDKLDTAKVANNLTTDEEGYALDARQGRDIRMVIENSVKPVTAILAADAWTGTKDPYTQTVSVAGVTADNVVIASASTDSFAEYGDCGIRCIEQAENSLTFAADDIPKNQLIANVVILNGGTLSGGEQA